MLDHDSPVDLHEQLSNLLREQIKSGQLSGRIPSIKSLAQEYEVSTGTVERSLGELRRHIYGLAGPHFILPVRTAAATRQTDLAN